MTGEWTTIRLGDACFKIGSGATPRGGSRVYPGHAEVALIRSQNVHNNGFRRDGLVFITPEHANDLENVEVMPGDVLLNITGDSVARCCQVDNSVLPARVSQHVAIIRPNPRTLDPRFLRYLLVSPDIQARLLSWARSGGTRNALTKSMIESLKVLVPVDVDEQRAIAHILGTLDDKIELNRRMNETLEAIARALFKSWFVDFEPVRAKMEGRWRKGKSLPGLPARFWDLFPERLVQSEVGEIPEGWEVKPFGDLIQTVKGRSYKSEELVEVESNTALVTLKSFARGGGYRPNGLKPFAGTYKPEQVVKPGEIVIACTDVTQAAEVIGRPAIVRQSARYQRLVASLDTLIARPKDGRMTRAFAYFLSSTDTFMEHTYAHTTGTTVLHLAKEAVLSFRFPLPSEELVRAFDLSTAPILARIQDAELESETLAALRDALLPKLISGEIRVADTEQFLGTTPYG